MRTTASLAIALVVLLIVAITTTPANAQASLNTTAIQEAIADINDKLVVLGPCRSKCIAEKGITFPASVATATQATSVCLKTMIFAKGVKNSTITEAELGACVEENACSSNGITTSQMVAITLATCTKLLTALRASGSPEAMVLATRFQAGIAAYNGLGDIDADVTGVDIDTIITTTTTTTTTTKTTTTTTSLRTSAPVIVSSASSTSNAAPAGSGSSGPDAAVIAGIAAGAAVLIALIIAVTIILVRRNSKPSLTPNIPVPYTTLPDEPSTHPPQPPTTTQPSAFAAYLDYSSETSNSYTKHPPPPFEASSYQYQKGGPSNAQAGPSNTLFNTYQSFPAAGPAPASPYTTSAAKQSNTLFNTEKPYSVSGTMSSNSASAWGTDAGAVQSWQDKERMMREGLRVPTENRSTVSGTNSSMNRSENLPG
ncbi:hypothetical protein HDU96_005009, partial [Phlyctochytrium bullatum]